MINQLTGFFNRATKDNRLSSTHISLFAAMYQCCQKRAFANPFQITRKELMKLCKIASTATYHKCIKELDEYGYIHYQPSYHPKIGSLIHWPTDQYK